jgi:twitching motility protein PilT
MDIEELLRKTVESKASDLHLSVGAPPMTRIHGEIDRLPYPELTRDTLRTMLISLLTGEQQNRFEEKRDLDFSIEIPDLARFRCNFFVGRRGEGAVFRVIPTEIKTMAQLNLPPVLAQLARAERGLVLVTGPTGSGKSTTLAAMVDLINTERHAHILTIEDPIEFVHPHKNCLVNQREVRVHTETFGSALRAALREDPDVILVGEMRDLETISLAVSAAETGHLVFGTLHTSSAPQTVDRIIDVFPPHQQSQIRTQLSESLQGVVAQTLLPKIGGGRAAALEIMFTTPAVKNLIREGKTFQLPSIIETNTNLGMQTLEQALMALIKSGQITTESALAKGLDPKMAGEMRLGSPVTAMPSATLPAAAPKLTIASGTSPTEPPADDLDDLAPINKPRFSFGR